jgi:hypothetical protein
LHDMSFPSRLRLDMIRDLERQIENTSTVVTENSIRG